MHGHLRLRHDRVEPDAHPLARQARRGAVAGEAGDDVIFGAGDTDAFTHGGDGNDVIDGGDGRDGAVRKARKLLWLMPQFVDFVLGGP